MMMLVLLIMLQSVPVLIHGGAANSGWKEKQNWSAYFDAAGVHGCFLFYDLQRNEYLVYNPERANTGFLPASTFKIFNSLVALETGAVRDESEVIKWDGVERMAPAWNQDHNMRSAFKNSTVWFYQEMARRVGRERMQQYVDKAGYGNRNIGGRIDSFWLDGDLRTTAKQQIEFLVMLHRSRLPFSPSIIKIVKDIFTEERTERYLLRAKTGWAGLGDKSMPQIGWWVGYVERGDEAYFFAMNIDIKKDEDAAARKSITNSILREMKVIE